MTDKEQIWLEPECCAGNSREWSPEYEQWDHDPAGEPGHDTPTEYVRADLYTAKIIAAQLLPAADKPR